MRFSASETRDTQGEGGGRGGGAETMIGSPALGGHGQQDYTGLRRTYYSTKLSYQHHSSGPRDNYSMGKPSPPLRRPEGSL